MAIVYEIISLFVFSIFFMLILPFDLHFFTQCCGLMVMEQEDFFYTLLKTPRRKTHAMICFLSCLKQKTILTVQYKCTHLIYVAR